MRPHSGKTIRDAVHGDIWLSRRCLRLVDTAPMQRLRHVKQLGTVHLVYPSAVHTRFEHSLGTAWLAHRILDAIERNSNTTIDQRDRELVIAACLLHDITHVPFGHTIEDERKVFPRHDRDAKRLRHYLGAPDLSRALRSLGLEKELIHLLQVRKPLEEERPFLSQIVSHTICADLLDYLARDNYFCGLKQFYDDRLLRSFRLRDDRLVVDLEKRGFIRHDVLSELIHLLRIRYNMTERVYFHHAKVSSGVMISRAVELAVAEGLRARDLYDLGDEALVYLLKERFGAVPGVRALLERLARRALYRRCYVLTADLDEGMMATFERRYHRNYRKARDRAERAIAEDLGLAPHQVIIYCPPAAMQLKEAEVLVRLGDGALRSLAELDNPEVLSLQAKYRTLWRFVVLIDPDCPAHLVAKAGTACERYFGVRNQLQAERMAQLRLF